MVFLLLWPHFLSLSIPATVAGSTNFQGQECEGEGGPGRKSTALH